MNRTSAPLLLTTLLALTLTACEGADGVGSPGPAGPAGPAGPMGLPGTAANQGATGPQGAVGPIGQPGTTGPQGQQGLPGAQGPAGAMGAPGQPGMMGATGPAGPAGPMGQQGPAGQGSPGATGPAGPSKIVQTVACVGTLPATLIDVTYDLTIFSNGMGFASATVSDRAIQASGGGFLPFVVAGTRPAVVVVFDTAAVDNGGKYTLSGETATYTDTDLGAPVPYTLPGGSCVVTSF